MKIIDLLNKIANGEDLPEKIYYGYSFLTLNEEKNNYLYEDSDEYYGNCLIHWFNLNDEVEIIEEEPYVEICGSWFTKSEYDKLFLEGEKKIPEKLEMLSDNEHYSNKVLYGKINEIIDYLKSKGE